jgi:hypothetical protein
MKRKPRQPRKSKSIHPLIKAQIRAKWNGEAVKAQIHALTGADKDKVLAFGSILFFVASACAMWMGWNGDEPEYRIIRGSVNALDDLSDRAEITDVDRGAIYAGMMAAQKIIQETPIEIVDEAAWLYAEKSKEHEKGKT